jgi:DHA2 family multidrug resistance protein
MSTAALAAPSVTKPDRIAAMRAALPADLAHSPLLGIAAVIIGAASGSLAARLLSLGLADFRGHLAIGVDEAAWISTAFNAPTMFIGPLTVYLGAILGPRRVLLACTLIFAISSACLPFVHGYRMAIALLMIAGLSSGTFYPLTVTFMLLNIPLRYLAITIGVYATCVEGALNFAPSLYGFYRDQLSWTGMFWTSTLVAAVMAVLVYYGIPRPRPRAAASGPKPSFRGFLYAGAGLTLLFTALDQGQRLDWWRSAVFTALFASGMFLLGCAIVRRLRAPNPLVDLPYLRKWNVVVLAVALGSFRFILLATAFVIPQTLAFRGLDAAQFAPAVFWTAVAEMFCAVFAGYLLNKGTDSRLLMALGFAMVAVACLINADFTSAWAPANYFRTELLMAVGQSFAFVGLVSTLVLQALFSGAAESPYRALTFGAFFHLVRILGGQIGIAVMGRFIAEQEKLHSYLIGLHVQSGGWIADHTTKLLAAGLAARSSGPGAAAGRAVGLVAGAVRQQAYALTFIDAFHLIAWASVAMLILLATLGKFPLNYGDLAALDARAGEAQTGDHS